VIRGSAAEILTAKDGERSSAFPQVGVMPAAFVRPNRNP